MFIVKAYETMLRVATDSCGVDQHIEIYNKDTRLIKDIRVYLPAQEQPERYIFKIADQGTALFGQGDKTVIKAICTTGNIVISIECDDSIDGLEVKICFDASDSFEVRGLLEPLNRTIRLENDSNTIQSFYSGIDSCIRGMKVDFEDCSALIDILDSSTAKVKISNKNKLAKILFQPFFENGSESNQPNRNYREDFKGFGTCFKKFSNTDSFPQFWIEQAKVDLFILQDYLDDGSPYFCAGLPWFATLFGRDSIITAEQLLSVDPIFAKQSITALSTFQSTIDNPSRDAQKGKIAHEIRYSERCNVNDIPFGRYYGAIDSTLLYISLIRKYLSNTSDYNFASYIRDSFFAALSWTLHQLENKYILYSVNLEQEGPYGLKEKGWKDGSPIIHANGEDAKHPIALCEVQGYAYRALLDAAWIITHHYTDQIKHVPYLKLRAERLKSDFNQDFWSEKIGTYVLALDGNGDACEVVSSNPGHLFRTGIIDDQIKKEKIVKTMMDPQLLYSGWGIRTLSLSEKRYDPNSYQLGGVWPHDTTEAIRGIYEAGFVEEAKKLSQDLIKLAKLFDGRMPELVSGHARVSDDKIEKYFMSCAPQAWSASIPFCLYDIVKSGTL